MRELYVSFGAFIGRYNGRNPDKMFEIAESITCDGFEFMMYNDWYPEIHGIIRRVTDKSLPIKTFHADKLIGEFASLGDFSEARARMKKNCEYAHALGADKIILHLWNGKPSDNDFENNIKVFPYLYECADSLGIELLPENVVCAIGSPIDRLLELSDIYPYAKFTFDTKMSAFHDELDAVYLPERRRIWDGRVSHIHLNDYAGGYKNWSTLKTLHLGKGDIDFDEFFSFIKSVNYSGTYTLECSSLTETGELLLSEMRESVQTARKYIENAKGDKI